MLYSCGLQVADAPLARQSSAASAKPSRLVGTARRPRTRRRRNSIARVARRKEISRSRLPLHGRNCFIFWRIFLPGGVRGAFTLQCLLLNAGRARSLQVGISTSVLVSRCEGKPALAPAAPTRTVASTRVALNARLPNRPVDCRLRRRMWRTRSRNPCPTRGHCPHHSHSMSRMDWRKWGD